MREPYLMKLANGTQLELRYMFKSLRFIEKATGSKFFVSIGQVGVDFLAASIAAGLQHKDAKMSAERAENLIEAHLAAGGELPAVADQLVEAFKAAGILKRGEDEEASEPTERPTPALLPEP